MVAAALHTLMYESTSAGGERRADKRGWFSTAGLNSDRIANTLKARPAPCIMTGMCRVHTNTSLGPSEVTHSNNA